MGEPTVDWTPHRVPLCVKDFTDNRDSLIGFCGDVMPHRVLLSIAGPVDPVPSHEVVLCTHTSIDALSLPVPMLENWRGPASVAVFGEITPENIPILQDWVHRIAGMGLRQVVVSAVGFNEHSRTAYDRLYPANLLRQTAVDAAFGNLVLLADPGFIPAADFYETVAASSALGLAMRAVLASAPTAFVVASFVTFQDAPDGLALPELARLVDFGEAVSFDSHVCFICRSFAWQWLLLNEPASAHFRAVEPGDLHHPAWLVERSVLPRLPGFMHGLVTPRSGSAKLGWTALPSGLKVSTEQLRANQVQLLLLPNLFLYRADSALVPSHHWEDLNDWFPLHAFFDLLLRRVLASLPPANSTGIVPRTFLLPGQLVEVLPSRHLAGDVLVLKHGSEQSLQLIVMASTIIASEGLELLLASVPWTVYAIAVGAKDYWAAAMRQLPGFLRSLPANPLVAIVDAYDVVLFPCSRSIVAEYAAYGKDIVWAADTSCFPNPAVCKTCEDRYPAGSSNLDACRAFPYLNGGCYMGSATALADALEWMRRNGAAGGRDDQENKWHYYNRFPDKVVLDHKQRIFSCFFGCDPAAFHVKDCTVVSNYTGEDICFAHANGGTKFEILAPMLQELARRGCIELPRKRKASAYAGIAYPKLIWS